MPKQLSHRAKRLVRAGKALFGGRYQSALARLIGVSQPYIARLTTTANEIRQLTRETLRVVGWEFEFTQRTVAWHAPIASILAIVGQPGTTESDRAPGSATPR